VVDRLGIRQVCEAERQTHAGGPRAEDRSLRQGERRRHRPRRGLGRHGPDAFLEDYDGRAAGRLDEAEARQHGGGADGRLAREGHQTKTLLGHLGMEFAEQAAVDTVLVSVGGGGLLGGVAAWFAGAVKVVGVEPESAPTLTEALKAGRPVDAPAGGIAADSLAPRRVGELMFPIARAHVAQVALVSDDAIRRAQDVLWSAVRIVAEPGGAAAFAALLSGAYTPAAGERVGVVVSGGNSTAVDFGRA